MSINNKLTGVIQGRTVQGTSNADDKLSIHFDDGSVMTVQTQGNSNSAFTGGKVTSVWQTSTALTLGFENGAKWDVPAPEETASVMVRDRDHKLEYAG